MRSTVRKAARAIAPVYMADRARHYEIGLRSRVGLTGLAERFVALHGPTVQRGPCQGLSYSPDRLAEVDAPVVKLLGVYERQLHAPLAEVFQHAPETFIDIGCAEGYYAVGITVNAQLAVHAFDLSRMAQRSCRDLAQHNGVRERVHVKGRCDRDELAKLPLEHAVLLCDIEGAEFTFFDRRTVALLRHTNVIVELHELDSPGGTEALIARFGSTHTARLVQPMEADDFGQLDFLTTEERDLALYEGRPGDPMRWVLFTPR